MARRSHRQVVTAFQHHYQQLQIYRGKKWKEKNAALVEIPVDFMRSCLVERRSAGTKHDSLASAHLHSRQTDGCLISIVTHCSSRRREDTAGIVQKWEGLYITSQGRSPPPLTQPTGSRPVGIINASDWRNPDSRQTEGLCWVCSVQLYQSTGVKPSQYDNNKISSQVYRFK